MSWHIAAARDSFQAFAPEWDRLNEEIFGGHPFFDSRFVGPLLEHFGDGSEQLCVLHKAGTAHGALLLRPVGMGRWALFLPGQAQLGVVLLRQGYNLESLMYALPGFAWSIDLLALDPDFCPDWRGMRLHRRVLAYDLTINASGGDGFAAYWQARPGQLKKNMRRYQRRIAEQFGNPILKTISAADELETAIQRYGDLEMSGWKGRAGTAVHIGNNQGRFYLNSLRAFAATGQAMIAELYFGDRLAASRLLICNNRMWIILKTSYDESLAAYAPGRQLLYMLLESAFSSPAGRDVEFYTNATRDQAEWATGKRYVQHSQILRNGLLATLYGLANDIRIRLGRNKDSSQDAPPPLTPQRVEAFERIADLPPAATRLIDEASGDNIDLLGQWFDNLQRTAFPADAGIRYYVLDFDSQPTVVLPVQLIRKGHVRKILSLTNCYSSLYSPAMAGRATAHDLSVLLATVTRDQRRSHAMSFFPMDPTAPGYEALFAALCSIGWVPFRFFCFGNWFLTVQGTWSEYLASRDSQLRNTLRRKTKKFFAAGGTLEIISDPKAIPAAIEDYNRVYARSWKVPEPHVDFVPALIRWLAAEGYLRLGIARIDDRPVAAQIWIVRQGKASVFKLAYDKEFSQLAPGTVLTGYLMEHAIDRDGVTKVDYMIGDDPYKQSWMNHRNERWGIIAYNPRTLTGLALLSLELAGRLLRRITRSRLIPSMPWHRH